MINVTKYNIRNLGSRVLFKNLKSKTSRVYLEMFEVDR